MPRRVQRILRSKIHNPSENFLILVSAAAMSTLAYKYALLDTPFYEYLGMKIPNDALSIISIMFLISYSSLIIFGAISNLTLIIKINSEKYRAELLSTIVTSVARKPNVDNFRDAISKHSMFLKIEEHEDNEGKISYLSLSPVPAKAFWKTMEEFEIKCFINSGKVTKYEKINI